MNFTAFALAFAVVTPAVYGLCGNAHIDIFECRTAELNRALAVPGFPPSLSKRTKSCSLMAHNRGTNSDGEYERLTGAGWAMLAAFCGGIGLASGVAAGFVFRRKPS